MIRVTEQTILLVSDDAELWAAARREFEAKEEGLRVTTVSTLDAARRIMEDAAPTVILLEERSVMAESAGRLGKMPRLSTVVSALAVHAPVVVMGAAGHQRELDTLVAAGAADFVEHGGRCLPMALERVERRVKQPPAGGRKNKEVFGGAGEGGGAGGGGRPRHPKEKTPTPTLCKTEVFVARARGEKKM